jgi:hypothetical protein
MRKYKGVVMLGVLLSGHFCLLLEKLSKWAWKEA